MPEPVYRVVTLLCTIVKTVPIGTNLGLVEVLWMLVSGRLLATRGGADPGLGGDWSSRCGSAPGLDE